MGSGGPGGELWQRWGALSAEWIPLARDQPGQITEAGEPHLGPGPRGACRRDPMGRAELSSSS